MRYLLDTNIVIAAMKGVPRVRDKLGVTALSELVLSPVVLGELEHRVGKSRYRAGEFSRVAGLALEDWLV